MLYITLIYIFKRSQSSVDGLQQRRHFGSPHDQRSRNSDAAAADHSFRLSLSPVPTYAIDSTNVNETRRNTSDNSFGSLSPIARSAGHNNHQRSSDANNTTTAAYAGHRSADRSSRSLNRSRSRHNSSNNSSAAFCQSTPGSSGRYRTCSLGGTLGGSLENMTLGSNAAAAAVVEGRSRSRLAVRNLSRSFGSSGGRERDERRSSGLDALMLSVDRLRRHDNGTPERRRSRSTGADDDTVDGSSPDSTTGSCSVHSGTPSRKVSWSNRKNLSLSFDDDCAKDEGDVQDDGPDDDGDKDDAKPNNSLALMPADVNVSMVDVSEVGHRKLDVAGAGDSMTAAKGLCQTDSGFNEMEV